MRPDLVFKDTMYSEMFGQNLIPLDTVEGFPVRPGDFRQFGATALPGAVTFTVHSAGATSVALELYPREGEKPFAVLPFPEAYHIGNVWSMTVFGLDIEQFEYTYRLDGPYRPEEGFLFDPTRSLLDPYCRAVTGHSVWGERKRGDRVYRGRVVAGVYDWGNDAPPNIPMHDLVIYELHVRGFTRHPSSGVAHPGTYAGLREKIPYLKELGINCVELMPIFEFDEMLGAREHEGNTLLDYWGYNPICFFAPNTSYASEKEPNREGTELKELIRALHRNGIEVILDVVFNHTAEGNEDGPVIHMKGFDNRIYYMLRPDGTYFNFSGCGNTLNANHPVVQNMVVDSLRYWVTEFRVDGFRFDLASILGRDADGMPMENPPLLRRLAFDPILANTKLIAEAWDAGGLYQVGSFPNWSRWSEWNGKYRDDLRRFLKGDPGLAGAAAVRITGSADLYDPATRREASVNFITCHDGFPLRDLYSYNQKHNEANGWNNTDGTDAHFSWNCGVEGDTDDPEVLALRDRMVKNAVAVLLASHGTPMLLAGDEFGNTQYGNNNPYCQDNEISWLDWELCEKNEDLRSFFREMIALRKRHPVLRTNLAKTCCGMPPYSLHGTKPNAFADGEDDRMIGVLFAGHDPITNEDDVVYLAVNAWWEALEITLPAPPNGKRWNVAVDTGAPLGRQIGDMCSQGCLRKRTLTMNGRSVVLLTANAIKKG